MGRCGRAGTAAAPQPCPADSLRRESVRCRWPSRPRAEPSAPHREWAFASHGNAARAPQREHRTLDPASRPHVGLIDGHVGRLSRAVVLARGVQPRRLREGRPVVLQRTRIEDRVGGRAVPGEHLPFHVLERRLADQHLRERVRLGEKRPVEHFHRPRGVHGVPHLPGRDDVEHGQARRTIGIVERQPVAHASAAVVAHDREPAVFELFHQLDHRSGHRALRIRRVIGCGLRCVALPIARQVGNDERVLDGERRRDAVPHDMRLRIAVQEQHGRAASANAREDAAGASLDEPRLESRIEVGEHGRWNSTGGSETCRPPREGDRATDRHLPRPEGRTTPIISTPRPRARRL